MKLVRELYTDIFEGKRIHMMSDCEIAPVNIFGTILKVDMIDNEVIFYIRSDKNNKVYSIGGNSKNLKYEFI